MSNSDSVYLTPALMELLREMWEWRRQQPEFLTCRNASEYGRQLMLRALLDEKREKDDG